MKTETTYSVVFLFPEEIARRIKAMKMVLKDVLTWFPSCHSDPHMTICEFVIERERLPYYIARLRAFCKKYPPVYARMDGTDTFPTTYFVKPDDYTMSVLGRYAEALVRYILGRKITWKGHATIGRKLNPVELAAAKALFDGMPIDFRFLCDSIYLREFDPSLGQFRVIDSFRLSGMDNFDDTSKQLTLF